MKRFALLALAAVLADPRGVGDERVEQALREGRLAGAALEETDETFSLESFLARLGWQEEVGCQS